MTRRGRRDAARCRDRVRRPLAAALSIAGAWPATAIAHGQIPGIGHFGNGVLHPLVSPPHLIALLALGLLIGQLALHADGRARWPIAALALAMLAGLAATAVAGDPDTDRALLVMAAVAALAVAASWAPPAPVGAGLSAAIGAAVAVASGPVDAAGAATLGGAARAAYLAGSAVAILVIALWPAAVVSMLRVPWQRIAVRVVGSWFAAAALLVLALSWRQATG